MPRIHSMKGVLVLVAWLCLIAVCVHLTMRLTVHPSYMQVLRLLRGAEHSAQQMQELERAGTKQAGSSLTDHEREAILYQNYISQLVELGYLVEEVYFLEYITPESSQWDVLGETLVSLTGGKHFVASFTLGKVYPQGSASQAGRFAVTVTDRPRRLGEWQRIIESFDTPTNATPTPKEDDPSPNPQD